LLNLLRFAVLAKAVTGHGHITYPPSRAKGSLDLAGDCKNGACLWFSQLVEIPGEPTLNEERFRTYNVKVQDGSHDFTRKMPWRAPGSAPVLGQGCGLAGGSKKALDNGGFPPDGIKQGFDGLKMPRVPKSERATWKRGAVEKVAWAMWANHGGGYSWRLCPANSSKVDEACFQRTVLAFAGNATSTIEYGKMYLYDKARKNLPTYEIPRAVFTDANGGQWARNPIPACDLCDQTDCVKHKSWLQRQHCAQGCSGLNMSFCPPGLTQFKPPLPGFSGYVVGANGDEDFFAHGFPFSIVDHVKVPGHLSPGDYILSWRWDCEQSKQIWQNCADIVVA